MIKVDPETTEENLIAINAKEDRNEFLRLYDLYFDRVFNYARYRLPDAQIADDITAQTFEQALAKIKDFDPDKGVFGAWLFAIARNLIRTFYRKGQKYEFVSIDDLYSHPIDQVSPEETSEVAEEQKELLAALEMLKPRQRDILALKFAGRFTNREIASMTGLTEQNIGIIIHRAIKKLRNNLTLEEVMHE
jgi:RNA polymerase sigma-70 factor (ECF subfamily)